ncbi:hypothetical protein [Ammonifex thiophilus]|uniref:hypothetical protein n=1 Tax=Ammonifex thiophilus TaxID=444093 RepID=UPI001404180F|nr:hypothetical protein [Ammonifex thiophilus]
MALDLKEAFTTFLYGERVKGALLLATALLEQAQQPEMGEGGRRLYRLFLERVRQEAQFAYEVTGHPKFREASARLKEVIWELHLGRAEEAACRLGEAISLVTTALAQPGARLQEEGLL